MMLQACENASAVIAPLKAVRTPPSPINVHAYMSATAAPIIATVGLTQRLLRHRAIHESPRSTTIPVIITIRIGAIAAMLCAFDMVIGLPPTVATSGLCEQY